MSIIYADYRVIRISCYKIDINIILKMYEIHYFYNIDF